MKLKVSIVMFLSILASTLNYAQSTERVKLKVDSIFTKELSNHQIKNAFLSVYSEKHDFNWNFIGGEFQNGAKITKNNPFLVTSITKTFTATLIMMLQEEGNLNVEDPIVEYLSTSITKGLHVLEGEEHTNKVLIKHLLQHTSGIPDYFEDTPIDGPNFMEMLFTQPNKTWQPLEIIEFSKSHLKPHFLPGKGYHYSDTEYVLLGLLIEELTGKKFSEVLTELIFTPLNMNSSYMHLRSEPKDGNTLDLAEVFVEETDISTFKSLTADWAGGGMATTSEDLVKFIVALNTKQLVCKKSLKQMQKWTNESYGLDYGFGLRKFHLKEIHPLLHNYTLVGHSGSSGAYMYYSPEMEVYIVGTFNQLSYHKEHVNFMMKVLFEVNELTKAKRK